MKHPVLKQNSANHNSHDSDPITEVNNRRRRKGRKICRPFSRLVRNCAFLGCGFYYTYLVHQINMYSILNFPEAMCKIRVHDSKCEGKSERNDGDGVDQRSESRGPPRRIATITIPNTSPRSTASAAATKSGTKDEKPVGSWLTPEEWQLLKNFRWDDKLLFLLGNICLVLFCFDELFC